MAANCVSQHVRVLQQHADAAQAERRVGVVRVRHDAGAGERLDLLLAAPVQHADGDGVALHRLDDAGVDVGLRRLAGQHVAVHEQELAAQQPHAVRTGLRDQRQLGRDFQVGLQLHLDAAQRHGGQAAQPAQRCWRRAKAITPGAPGSRWRAPGPGSPGRRCRRSPRSRRPAYAPAAPIAPSTAGMPSARSMMAVWPSAPPSSVATPATRAGSISAASAGVSHSATRIGARRQSGEGAERRPGQVADQPARDLLHLVRPALAGRQVVGVHAAQGRGDRLRLVRHRLLGRAQPVGDAQPGPRSSRDGPSICT